MPVSRGRSSMQKGTPRLRDVLGEALSDQHWSRRAPRLVGGAVSLLLAAPAQPEKSAGGGYQRYPDASNWSRHSHGYAVALVLVLILPCQAW
jgi:hypothetical protein